VYIGNTYAPGSGTDCLSDIVCTGSETEFLDCKYIIIDHDDPSSDVSIQCYAGMILTVSVTKLTVISIARLRSSCADIVDSHGRSHGTRSFPP